MSCLAVQNSATERLRRVNPFSTRFIRPGAIPFIFSDDCDAPSLVALWQSQGRRGAIVGPHGSGKSTLLAALISALEESGERVLRVDLHNGQRRVPREFFNRVQAQQVRAIVVDGYEQLGWLNRKGLIWHCARNGIGLLLTCHGDVQLPVLFRTAVDASLAERIVAQLAPAADASITPSEIRRTCSLHGENFREALFALYDLHEQRVGRAASPSGLSRTG